MLFRSRNHSCRVLNSRPVKSSIRHAALCIRNAAWRIELFTGLLFNTRHEWFRERMPLCARGGGGQLWLRRVAA